MEESTASTGPKLWAQVRATFERNTAEHLMTIKHDDGVYRHLRFQKPERSSYWFDLITWPGGLVINGDMGSYTFARIDDMFAFFRDESVSVPRSINPLYWAEKLQADSGVHEFSEALFRQLVAEHIADYEGEYPGLAEAVQLQVFDDFDVSNETEARAALDQFEHDKFRFTDTWEWSFQEYSYRYLWCCHAIQWGIARYDANKKAPLVTTLAVSDVL